MMIAIHIRSVQECERSFGSTNKERVRSNLALCFDDIGENRRQVPENE